MEGEVKSLANGSVELRSVLFGIQKFAMSRQAQALVLRKRRDPQVGQAPLAVSLHNGSFLRATGIESNAGTLKISMPPQGSAPLAIPASQVKEVVRAGD